MLWTATVPRALNWHPAEPTSHISHNGPKESSPKGNVSPSSFPSAPCGGAAIETIKAVVWKYILQYLPDSGLGILEELLEISACIQTRILTLFSSRLVTTPLVIKTEFAPPSIPKLGCSGGQKLSPIFNHGLFTLTYPCCQHCAHFFFPCLIPDTDFFTDIPVLFWFCEYSFKCYIFHSSPILLYALVSKKNLSISKN